MKVVIEVDKGAHVGERYELELKAYRAVCREGVPVVTTAFANSGDQRLDPDDIRVVEEHLKKRAKEDDDGSVLRMGTFKRGRDILLDDEKISRTHAMFFLDDDGPSVVDLLSTNGTYVNGQQVMDADLHDGDIVHVGKTRLVVHVEAGGA